LSRRILALISDVWLWNEWPGRAGKHDTGIDLVAQNRITRGLVAIQCKFFASTSTIQKPDIDSFLSASGKEDFAERIIVSTTDKWNAHAEDAIKAQQIPVRRIGLSDFEASPTDWSNFSLETPEVLVTVGKKAVRPHQEAAIEAALTGFADGHDRGKLIMACGTGKTFTSLRLAERLVGAGGSVLFLVPSISLLSQTLREWCVEASVPLQPLAVCSDRKSTARSQNTNEDISSVDLALPATTNVLLFQSRLAQAQGRSDAMTVVFEKSWGKGSGKFLVIVTDHDTSRVVWVAQGRDQATVRQFFGDLGEERTRLLTHVSADGADWIHPVVREKAPQAQICLTPSTWSNGPGKGSMTCAGAWPSSCVPPGAATRPPPSARACGPCARTSGS
jgi:hypothetical protein